MYIFIHKMCEKIRPKKHFLQCENPNACVNVSRRLLVNMGHQPPPPSPAWGGGRAGSGNRD
jgi:hypothetical protein